jgi:hypothetical protein
MEASFALPHTRVSHRRNKTMKRLAAFPLVALAVALAPAPATAQSAADEPKVNQLIIYGDDKCPPSTANENTAWVNKVKGFEAVGKFGPLSCTPIGAGGELGCTAKMIEAAYAEKATSGSIRFNELIAKARQERLAKLDASAAATQARVEAIEKEQKRLEAQGVPPAQAAAQAEQAIADQQAQAQQAKP